MAGSCASTGLGHQAGLAPSDPSASFSPDQHRCEVRGESAGEAAVLQLPEGLL